MLDEDGGSLAQNHIDVRLVQKNGYFNKPIRGSNLQLLLRPAADKRGFFNPEDFPASSPHHMSKFAFCFGQAGHVLNLPRGVQRRKARRVCTAGAHFLDGDRRPGRAEVTRANEFVQMFCAGSKNSASI
jgi:hypothetical protein